MSVFGTSSHFCLDYFAVLLLTNSAALLALIASAVVSVVAIALVNRRLARRKATSDLAMHGDAQLCSLAEAIPHIVWTCTPDGLCDYGNKRWHELMRLTQARSLANGWAEMIHPDDRSLCLERWERCVRSGETFQLEYRLRDEAQGYRWYLGRAISLRGSSGVITKWFGTCTDIEDQKHHLQVLEEQIQVRTAELAAANTRLQQEMSEKDRARNELDQQNETMVRELTERSKRATLLAQMGELLQSCVSKEEAFAAALGFAPRIFSTTRGAIALLNPARNLAEFIGSWSNCQIPSPVFEPTACWALRTGHAHLVLAGDLTAPCVHAAGVKNTYLCIPILAQGEALGILHVQTTDEAPTIAHAELSFKTTFAAQLGLSIANIRLREALRSQSIKDALTGLYNRRYLEEMLEREIRRAVRTEQPLALLMLDLDHFKNFNDTYGHEAGDAVLRATGAFLVSSIRAEDVVCRFGGEEFVLILPTAGPEAALCRADRIRSKLRDLTVLHRGQSLGTISASVGVATLPLHGTSGAELLAAADAALYRAKRAGRDRVVAAETTVEQQAKLDTLRIEKPTLQKQNAQP